MFDHILQKTRVIYWQYGNVTCAGYPLDNIDTISKGGSLNEKSALSIIVRGVRDRIDSWPKLDVCRIRRNPLLIWR